MTQIELYLLAGAAVGLIICLRGGIRAQVADWAIGVFIAALASAGYFTLFSLTRTPFLGTLIHHFAFCLVASSAAQMARIASSSPSPSGTAGLGVFA